MNPSLPAPAPPQQEKEEEAAAEEIVPGPPPVKVYRSLSALREAGLCKTAEEERARQKADPKQAKLRCAPLSSKHA